MTRYTHIQNTDISWKRHHEDPKNEHSNNNQKLRINANRIIRLLIGQEFVKTGEDIPRELTEAEFDEAQKLSSERNRLLVSFPDNYKTTIYCWDN
jgi:hypothetical protein